MTPQQERLQLARLTLHSDPEAVVLKAIEAGYLRLEPAGGWPDREPSIAAQRTATAAAIFGDQTDDRQPIDITSDAQRIG